MNSAANIINSPNPQIAERSAGNPGASNSDDQSQVRFAEVLRGQQARNAGDAKEARDTKAAQGTEDPATTDPAGAPADSTTAAAPPPLLADPALMALMLDPAAMPAARALPLSPGGLASAAGIGMDAKAGPGSGVAGAVLPGTTLDAALAPDPASAAPSPAGIVMPFPASPVAPPGAAASAASGVRAEPRTGPIAGTTSELARGDATARGPQLPFGMAADSALRGETPAIEAGRADPGAWAAFAVPIDSAASRQAAATPLPAIEAPVGSPRFVNETAQQVTWLVKNGLSEAEIRVRPADMGPISVRIEMNQNEATISFAVTQPETRAAVQDSLHRLTEMLADSGISLGEANVGGQNFTRQSPDGGAAGRSRVTFAPGRGDDGSAGIPAAGRMIPERARGLVDTFA